MTLHHPQDDILLSYAAGSLGESWSIAIASHLAFCPQCRQTVENAENIGGILLEDFDPTPLNESALNQALANLDKVSPVEMSTTNTANSNVPSPLRDYIGNNLDDIEWKAIGGGAYQYLINTVDNDQARLLRIPAGKPVPEHGHRGRELTLVLSGSFSEQNGEFFAGDLQDADENITHIPHAGPNEDCICLAVTDAALKFTGIVPRIAQHFINI